MKCSRYPGCSYIRRFSRFGVSWFVLLAGTSTLLQAAVVYNFDADVLGKATPFSDTVSGLAATFTSSGDPGAGESTRHSPELGIVAEAVGMGGSGLADAAVMAE